MLLLISAAMALMVLLLALKLSQRLTLRLKVLAGVSVSRQPEKSCPHLGFAADPFSHEGVPSDDHRCYLWMQRDRIDLVHQKGFCLTSAHHKCPWLMIRRPDAPPPLRQRLPGVLAGLPRQAAGGLAMAFRAVAALPLRRKVSAAGLGAQVLPADTAAKRAGFAWPRLGRKHAAPSSHLPEGLAAAFPGMSGAPAQPSRAARLQERLVTACQVAEAGLAGAGRALAPRAATFSGQLRRGLLLAAVCTARAALIGGRAFGRSLLWLAPRLGHALVLLGRGAWWLARTLALLLARGFSASRRALEERRARAHEAAVQAQAAAARAAAVTAEVLPEVAPQPEREPVQLGRIEELIAEGLATLDRGEESLAYHIFAKASEQRAPKGASPEAYAELMKRAWFWRAKTAETVDEVVRSLEQALRLDPENLQMQAQLAWARQRLEREQRLQAASQTPAAAALPAPMAFKQPRRPWQNAVGDGVRLLGGLAALALAALWMTTGVVPAAARFLLGLPMADRALIQKLVLSLNSAALPGQGHLPLPVVNYDLGLALPFVLGFLFLFTARGLLDGDSWARGSGLVLAAVGCWLCIAAVNNPDAGRLGLWLCGGIIAAAIVGRFKPVGGNTHSQWV